MTPLRSQRGFTLIELIVAMTISTMTVLAVFAILDTTVKQSNAVAGRVNATQRARLTMDTITRQLRSQVCYSPTVPALVSGTDDAVKFHMDLSDGSKAIEQHELAFNPTARTLTERVWPGQGAPLTFPTQTLNRQLVGDVTRAQYKDGTVLPIFRYYAYNLAVPPRPELKLPTPLSATDIARVARIEVNFRALPPGNKAGSAAGAVSLQNEVYVRVADPNDPAPTPTCA
ncbi:MAG TPA: prepilin-type N-terminal cleavage/methylation domain-containing protein [Solirubrobacteraceae bacterium]|nr:prepilin-type N-terminal cleavage/methylation domain-containing protein [Solirubrobacteraceae bacterium]